MSESEKSTHHHIDLSKASDEELQQIHNEVARHIASRVKHPAPGDPHDSHSSNHSKNSIVMAAKMMAEKKVGA